MGKSFDPIGVAGRMRDAKLCNSTPRPIVSMSFQLAIAWRVALPQRPPPLHQPGTIMQQTTVAGHQKLANAQLCLNYLSHPRGQAQFGSHLPASKQAKGAPREHQAPSRSPCLARTGRQLVVIQQNVFFFFPGQGPACCLSRRSRPSLTLAWRQAVGDGKDSPSRWRVPERKS